MLNKVVNWTAGITAFLAIGFFAGLPVETPTIYVADKPFYTQEARPVAEATVEPAIVDAPIVEEEIVETIKPVKQTKSTKTIDTADVVASDPKETIFRMMESQSMPTWGLDRVDGVRDGVYNYISTGSGVRIYIVDTGVDAAHPDFGGRVTSGFDAFGEGLANTDCQGHGTHVAGIAAGSYFGVAKSATVVPVRVLDCNGVGTTSTLTSGIEWILANHSGGTGIVNMSLGGGQDDRVNSITSRLVDAGLIVVVAAGNAGQDACNYSPASARGAIAVAAIDIDDSRASFSNYGSCVDISAPGVGINSANADNYSISKRMSGTSQASPFVAGAVATYLSSGSASNSSTAESYMNQLAENGIVTVEVPTEEVVEPEPVVEEPEPVVDDPQPVVEEPAPVDDPSPEYGVTITQWEPGKGFASLEWSQVEGASSYRIYKTGSIRPGWRLYWTTDENGYKKTVTDAIGAIAIYRVTAVVGGSEVELGEVQYEPTN